MLCKLGLNLKKHGKELNKKVCVKFYNLQLNYKKKYARLFTVPDWFTPSLAPETEPDGQNKPQFG